MLYIQNILHGRAEIRKKYFTSEHELNIVQQERNFVSPVSHVMFYFLYRHQ